MVTLDTPVQLDARIWRVTWTSSLASPLYRVYRDGILIATQYAEEIEIPVNADEQAQIEVLDDPLASPSPAYPANVILGWATAADAAQYRIEVHNGASWEEVTTLEKSAEPWQSWSSGQLPDVTTYRYRVIPIDAAGNDGTAVEFTALLVRYPDAPDVSFSYDDDMGVVTIAEAA